MVILEQETEPKLKTPKQEALIYRLLQSKVFSKKEFEAFYKKVQKQIVTSYDASVTLNYLLAAIRFRKQFTGKHARSHAKCYVCNSRENLRRYCWLEQMKQFFLCSNCEAIYDSKEAVLTPSEVKEGDGLVTEMGGVNRNEPDLSDENGKQ